MSHNTAIVDELACPPEGVRQGPRTRSSDRPNLERWLCDHASLIALGIVSAGFAMRLWLASRPYLNPDEALHYYLVNQASVGAAYRASLTNAHPPLLFLITYFWHFLGRSELWLRLPSVFAGTAFCWLTFKWMVVFLGRAAALIGLVLVTFSPAAIQLSAEVREYPLLLCFMAAALYFLGKAFEQKSAREMWYFTAFLYLAILTHYSAAFFAFAIGVYALVRIVDSSQPRRVITAWAFGQLGAIAIYTFLYWTQLSRVKEVVAVWAEPFDRFYFHLGYQSYADLFGFLRENTNGIFQYSFGGTYVAQILFVLFLLGTVYLFVRGLRPARGNPGSCHLGILVIIPFLAVWGAAIAEKYPYVGSRHTIFLLPFLVAAVSAVLAAAVGNRLWASLVIALALMGFGNFSGKEFSSNFLQDNQRALMTAAITAVHESIPRDELILVDYQSSGPLIYYLCGPRPIIQIRAAADGLYRFECADYTIVSLDYHFWRLTPRNFIQSAKKMAQTFGLRNGDRFWVFETGWGTKLDTELRGHQQGFACLPSKRFGSGVAIMSFVVDAGLSPGPPDQTCAEQHDSPGLSPSLLQ